jgi:hypothetical protein
MPATTKQYQTVHTTIILILSRVGTYKTDRQSSFWKDTFKLQTRQSQRRIMTSEFDLVYYWVVACTRHNNRNEISNYRNKIMHQIYGKYF